MGITIEDLPVEDLHPNPNNPRRQVGDVADLEALIGFGWNLPITEHDGDHWSLECKENLDQIRMVLRDRPLRILDVLAARQEDNANWRAWRTMRGVDEMCVWYGALEHLGYQPSAEEREALKGAMVEKEQES